MDKKNKIVKYALAAVIIAALYLYGNNGVDFSNPFTYLLTVAVIVMLISWWLLLVDLAEKGFWWFLLGLVFWPFLFWYGFVMRRDKLLPTVICFTAAITIGALLKKFAL